MKYILVSSGCSTCMKAVSEIVELDLSLWEGFKIQIDLIYNLDQILCIYEN